MYRSGLRGLYIFDHELISWEPLHFKLHFQNGKTLSVGAEMCKKSSSLFKVRDSRTADFRLSKMKVMVSLNEVWILWCSCDYFCYISCRSTLVGGKIFKSTLPV